MEEQSPFFFLVYLGAAFIYVVFLYIILRKREYLGARLDTRIYSLALTCIFYFRGIRELFFTLPETIISGIVRTYPTFMEAIGLKPVNEQTEPLNSADTILMSWLDYSSMIIGLAIWMLCASIINSLNAKEENLPNRKYPIFRKANDVMVLILFIASVYLCLASIIAIPLVNERAETKDESQDAAFFERLDGIITKIPTSDSIKGVDEQLYLRAKALLSDSIPSISSGSDSTQNLLPIIRTKALSLKGNIENTYFEMATTLQKTQKSQLTIPGISQSYVEAAKKAYNANKNNTTERELRAYRNHLEQWVNSNIQYIKYIAEQDKSNFQWSLNEFTRQLKKIEGVLTLAYKNRNSDLENLLSTIIEFDYATVYFSSNNDQIYTSQLPPEPDTSSFSLGMFSSITRFLTSNGNTSYALIVGMLGFGLFGAMISTFVRERKRKKEAESHGEETTDRPIISDLTGVLVRGLSAAVVIFLSIMGGLVVFNAEAASPNPYVLFLTCLIGAVFSERVWNWAQGYIIGKYPPNAAPTATPGKPEGSKSDQETNKGDEPSPVESKEEPKPKPDEK
jgi:hypothetical protein